MKKTFITIVGLMMTVIAAVAQTLTANAPSHVAVGEQFLRRGLEEAGERLVLREFA